MTIQELRERGAKTRTRVRYVPFHAHGDRTHPDCEDGSISTFNDNTVFVKFDKKLVRHGWDGTTSEACDPESLILI